MNVGNEGHTNHSIYMGLIKTAKLFSKRYKNLLLEMIRTDFKLRYQGSMLGYLWSLLKPLMLFGILYTVFTHFLLIGKGVPNWPVSLLLGIVMWSFFTDATSGSLKSVVGKGNLIRKVNIPRWLIPVASISSAFINMLLNLVVVFVFIGFASSNALSWQTIYIFPLLLLELIVLTVAVGFFLSAIYVRYRDIEHIWDVVRQALFYTVPIIYPLSRIPSETVQKIIMANPLAQIIQDARAITTHASTPQISDVYSSLFMGLVPLALVVVSLVIGANYFRKHSPYFAEDI